MYRDSTVFSSFFIIMDHVLNNKLYFLPKKQNWPLEYIADSYFIYQLFIRTTMKHCESVADSVIQATGMVEFEDGMRK